MLIITCHKTHHNTLPPSRAHSLTPTPIRLQLAVTVIYTDAATQMHRYYTSPLFNDTLTISPGAPSPQQLYMRYGPYVMGILLAAAALRVLLPLMRGDGGKRAPAADDSEGDVTHTLRALNGGSGHKQQQQRSAGGGKKRD